MLIDDYLNINTKRIHHAVLLISRQFEQHALPYQDLKAFAERFCQIQISNQNLHHPDILIIDRDRTLLRLEDVHKIKDFILYPPQIASKRLIFIEKCDRLNLNSTNFLLKSIEEPNSNVLFLLTTSKKYLILPTILSRVQKIQVSFKSISHINHLDLFEPLDLDFFKKMIFSMSYTSQPFIFFGKSLSDKKPFCVSAKYLNYLIENCEQLSKKYTAEQLQNIILHWVSVRLKKEDTFVIITRFIIAHLREWKRAEPLNPSSHFWLLRIFLGHNTYANS